jgi:hypothetical protein
MASLKVRVRGITIQFNCYRIRNIEGLIVDEWRAIELVEALRGKRPGWLRMGKLKGLLAARSAIKAKRFRQMGNPEYSRQIAKTARRYTGVPIWLVPGPDSRTIGF